MKQRLRFAVLLVLMAGATASVHAANPFMGNGDEAGRPVLPPSAGFGMGGPAWLAELQLSFREEAGRMFGEVADGQAAGGVPWRPVLVILGTMFLYGVLHAAGPGHRKTIVFSLFLGNKAPWWQPLAAGFLSAGIHGAMSLAIVGLLYVAKSGAVRLFDAETGVLIVEYGASFLLLALALVLIVLKTRRVHHCYHGNGKGSIWVVVASASAVPCSGAILVLLLALHLDMLALGALAVLSMSIGMGLVVSAAGYLAWAGRTVFFNRLKQHEGAVQVVSDVLEYAAYAFLLVVAVLGVYPLVMYWLK